MDDPHQEAKVTYPLDEVFLLDLLTRVGRRPRDRLASALERRIEKAGLANDRLGILFYLNCAIDLLAN